MILPIVGFGSPVLRQVCADIDQNYPELDKLLADMWETMYHSRGVGIAAPQINKAIRVFLVDSEQIFANAEDDEMSEYPDGPGFKGAFINAKIKSLNGREWSYNEGCLSIPKIREDIYRNEEVTLDYLDENFQQQTRSFNGITGRIILHEYDHIEGKLFIDYLKPLKKRLLKRKLEDISNGKVSMDYRMIFPK
jgi:peptide deformylase